MATSDYLARGFTKKREREPKVRVLLFGVDSANAQVIEEAGKLWSVLETITTATTGETKAILSHRSVDVVFCELSGLDEKSCNERLQLMKTLLPHVPVILIVPERRDGFLPAETKKLGLFDVVASPCQRKDLQWMLIRTIQHLRRVEEMGFRVRPLLAG